MPSSVIRRFRYREPDLDIEFVNGRRYRYLDVPAAVYRALRVSPSKGAFFNARIRNRFAFQRLA
jgi:lysyl-tRNA synthetase class 2